MDTRLSGGKALRWDSPMAMLEAQLAAAKGTKVAA
jgi:hypothetical protein